ncbi:MAG TPA: 50S ribosomal protein L13 [Candidatus Saccharimonadales bacterium]|nr:50S ribosomal protein L13 [Candidatus Saccharimonadales bacterium]
MMRTYSLKPSSINRQWHVIDASEASLGRTAAKAAALLIGKHKPVQSPHIDGGDYVVIINSDKLQVTGNKEQDKLYRRHSGYPGGLKETPLKDLSAQNSAEIIRRAVRGMLPVNKLRKGRLDRLKIYTGSEHPHHGQAGGQKPVDKKGGE